MVRASSGNYSVAMNETEALTNIDDDGQETSAEGDRETAAQIDEWVNL